MSQLGLFAAERSPGDNATNRALAARLPRELRMGTSSWSFPGMTYEQQGGGQRALTIEALARAIALG